MIYETLEDWKELAQHLRRELDTSQADVTRLTAELAESVRALAVSQGEVERLRGELARVAGDFDSEANDHAATLDREERLRGDLERARGGAKSLVVRLFANTRHFQECVCVTCEDARAFLAPPTPTASPEPDRASPEATPAGAGDEACECALPGVGNPVDCLHPLRAICQCACHSPVAPVGPDEAPGCIGECELGKCLRCWGPAGTGGRR